MMNRETKEALCCGRWCKLKSNYEVTIEIYLSIYTWDHIPLLFFAIPEIMSSVHSFMYGRISKCGFATSLSKFSSKIRIFSLNIGINVRKTFKLNDGFMSRRIGRHTADARFNENLNVVFILFFEIFQDL